ncbi:MAG: lytic transglycosylase domain-containing protein, partial [Pseudomonadota bacterium]|nr:lytic transglycosylase domain-containing protein [Pseudomonadota bacterium]
MSLNKDMAGVENFLLQHNGTIYADKLRAKYLQLLARQQDTSHFIAAYQPTNDLALQCYYLNAQIAEGQKDFAYLRAAAIWHNEPAVPSRCLNLFKSWITDVPLSEDALFERFYLAIAAEQWAQLPILEHYMNDEQRAIAAYWLKVFKKPSLLDTEKLPRKNYARLIALTAMHRLAHNHIDTVEGLWIIWSKQYHYSNDEINSLVGKIVVHHAMHGDKITERWVRELRPGKMNPNVYEWRVRSALIQKDWPLVQRAVFAMPIELRAQACWSYWLARAYDHQGQHQQAKALLQIVGKFDDFYAFMAQRYIGQPVYLHRHKMPPPLKKNSFPYSNELEYIHELKTQQKLGEAQLLNSYLESQSTDEQKLIIAKVYYAWHWYSQAINVLMHSVYKDVLELEYPLGYSSIVNEYSAMRSLPPALVYAIMRQESRFQTDAHSSAGAMGLMQLMPRTAQMTAKHQKLKISDHDLANPQVNILLGTAYLQQLLNKFQHPVLACAAYNAGERIVNQWRQTQDPNDMV